MCLNLVVLELRIVATLQKNTLKKYLVTLVFLNEVRINRNYAQNLTEKINGVRNYILLISILELSKIAVQKLSKYTLISTAKI